MPGTRRRCQPKALPERRLCVDDRTVTLETDQLDSFMADHYPSVVRTVAVACGDIALAHDAVQEALARALDQQRRGRSIDHLPGWIVVVALNQLRTSFRRRGREARALLLLSARDDGAASSLDTPSLIDLQRAIVRLPLRQRQCIVLHHLRGYGVDELSTLLGVSSGTVKSALFRGRESLRRSLSVTEVSVLPTHPPTTTQEAAP
jgi:RNA polymerase sigma factor (sigma-70 family)